MTMKEKLKIHREIEETNRRKVKEYQDQERRRTA